MFIKFSLHLITLAFLLGITALSANAANAIVTVANDPVGVGSCTVPRAACSLRQAINTVSNNDSIFFDLPAADCPNGVCTISLRNGLTILKSIVFIGPGARNLIIKPSTAANTPSFTIFNIGNGQVGGSAVMSGLTISDGFNNSTDATGGIFVNNRSSLNLNNVAVVNCSGTYAGGITNIFGDVIITNSLIANNEGRYGGAVVNIGTTTIVNSTVSGNIATDNTNSLNGIAGGIVNGLSNDQQGTLTLINVTVANNLGPRFSNTASDGVTNLFSNSTTNVRNTIIAGNGVGSNNIDVSGSFVSRGNNLVFNVPFGGGGFGGAGSNDILNQSANLGQLINNGGQTDTMALLTGSPAINAGNDCVLNSSCATNNPPFSLTFDQRGQPFNRKSDSAVDIGSYEFQKQSTTAAGVSIGGRVFASANKGLVNARVMLTTTDGKTRTISTSAFGYYRFDDITAGQTAVLTIVSKRYQFAPQVMNVTEDLTDLNFLPQ